MVRANLLFMPHDQVRQEGNKLIDPEPIITNTSYIELDIVPARLDPNVTITTRSIACSEGQNCNLPPITIEDDLQNQTMLVTVQVVENFKINPSSPTIKSTLSKEGSIGELNAFLSTAVVVVDNIKKNKPIILVEVVNGNYTDTVYFEVQEIQL